MRQPSAWEREAAEVAREVTRRAAWRLDILEWVILTVAAGLAVTGGALLAWLVAGPSGFSFRLVWLTTSMLLFVVPGTFATIRFTTGERTRRRESKGVQEELND